MNSLELEMEELLLTPVAIWTLVISILLSIGGVWMAYNINFLPVAASLNSPIYDELFRVLFIIGVILFVGMTAFVIYSLIEFRRKPEDTGDGIPIEGNLSLEIFWTAIPAVVVLFIGLYSYDIYDRMGGMQPLSHAEHLQQNQSEDKKIWAGIGPGSEGSKSLLNNEIESTVADLPIELTALQFAFIFHYPKGDITSGELHVPVGQRVSMKMESKDVIHAFWVPQFRIKQDIIPGQPTLLSFTPTKTGNYPVVCAELCGPYHGGMRAAVVVEKEEDYQDWFNKNATPPISET